MQKFFVDFLSGFAEIFYIYAAKKSFNISFLMEEGMVCEKQKLAGIAETEQHALPCSNIPPKMALTYLGRNRLI